MNESASRSIASALRRRRQTLGRSQADVARDMRTSQKAVSRLEAGLVDPRLSTLDRWARAVGCRLAIDLREIIDTPDLVGFEDLPGYDLIAKGMGDLRAGRETEEALAMAVVAPRLQSDGMVLPEPLPSGAKGALWDLLERQAGDDAHSRYNALIGRLLSFAASYETARTRGGARATAG